MAGPSYSEASLIPAGLDLPLDLVEACSAATISTFEPYDRARSTQVRQGSVMRLPTRKAMVTSHQTRTKTSKDEHGLVKHTRDKKIDPLGKKFVEGHIFCHPIVVLSRSEQNPDTIYFCPVTSIHGRTVKEQFSTLEDYEKQQYYLPLHHSAPHSIVLQPSLSYDHAAVPTKGSYVRTDEVYEVPLADIVRFYDGAEHKTKGELWELDQKSLQELLRYVKGHAGYVPDTDQHEPTPADQWHSLIVHLEHKRWTDNHMPDTSTAPSDTHQETPSQTQVNDIGDSPKQIGGFELPSGDINVTSGEAEQLTVDRGKGVQKGQPGPAKAAIPGPSMRTSPRPRREQRIVTDAALEKKDDVVAFQAGIHGSKNETRVGGASSTNASSGVRETFTFSTTSTPYLPDDTSMDVTNSDTMSTGTVFAQQPHDSIEALRISSALAGHNSYLSLVEKINVGLSGPDIGLVHLKDHIHQITHAILSSKQSLAVNNTTIMSVISSEGRNTLTLPSKLLSDVAHVVKTAHKLTFFTMSVPEPYEVEFRLEDDREHTLARGLGSMFVDSTESLAVLMTRELSADGSFLALAIPLVDIVELRRARQGEFVHMSVMMKGAKIVFWTSGPDWKQHQVQVKMMKRFSTLTNLEAKN